VVVDVTVVAELEWETDLKERMEEAVGGERILLLMPASLGLTGVGVMSRPERAGILLPLAVDSATPSATARVAAAVSRLQENPKQLVDALGAQGVTILVDDLGVEVTCAPLPSPSCVLPPFLADFVFVVVLVTVMVSLLFNLQLTFVCVCACVCVCVCVCVDVLSLCLSSFV
jgi:hypothetical protein